MVMKGVRFIDAADDDDDPLCEIIICAYSPFVWSLSTPGCTRALCCFPFFRGCRCGFSFFVVAVDDSLRFEHRHEKKFVHSH